MSNASGARSSRLTPEWHSWVVENLARGVTPTVIANTLGEHGFGRRLAERAIASVRGSSAVSRHARGHSPGGVANLPLEKLRRRYEKLAWTLSMYERCADAAPRTVAYCESPTRSVFFQEFYARNRPVVISGAISEWSAPERWTFERMRAELGHHEVEIQGARTSDAAYERNSLHHKERMRFADYVDWVAGVGESNDRYMTANNAEGSAPFLRDVLGDAPLAPRYTDHAKREGRMFFWFGPKGTLTPLHHDMTNNGMAQVRGRKRVILSSPNNTPYLYNDCHCFSEVDFERLDLARFPLAKRAHVLSVTLEPGQILFIPVGWWHQVRALEASVTLSFTHFDAENDFSAGYENLGRAI